MLVCPETVESVKSFLKTKKFKNEVSICNKDYSYKTNASRTWSIQVYYLHWRSLSYDNTLDKKQLNDKQQIIQ